MPIPNFFHFLKLFSRRQRMPQAEVSVWRNPWIFFTRIAENTPQLNRSDNEILSYCVRHHEQVARLKVTELADKLFISPASVIRFCKKLGFSGFAEFKASLRMELGETPGIQKQIPAPPTFSGISKRPSRWYRKKRWSVFWN